MSQNNISGLSGVGFCMSNFDQFVLLIMNKEIKHGMVYFQKPSSSKVWKNHSLKTVDYHGFRVFSFVNLMWQII